MEKVRANLKQEALKRQQKFRSYPNAQQLQKELDKRCTPIERAIDSAFTKSFCAAGCPNTTVAYTAALDEVHQAAQSRMGADYVKDLRVCMTEVVALDRDRSSYAMSVMLRLAVKSEQSHEAVIWASSSLALGKGVPASRNDAIRTLQEIARPDLPENYKNLLTQLALSLF